ncbi:hypothetical protein CRENBAI_016904 [Crenichthys baileyi]|uniref:Uncharacterized protein n=1 Tax=Crenichthys baileyi TaxID=28760 RepID=A0AAV9RR49_9TELE
MPEQIQPWIQRPKTLDTPPPSRGLTEPRGPGPGKQPPGVSQHTPKHSAPDTENHKATPNKDTDIEHMPPNPNATSPLPHRGTPPQVNSIAERPMKPHPHSASSTNSPALSTPAAPRSPTTKRSATARQGPSTTPPPPTAATGQNPPSTTPTTGTPTPHHDGTNSPTKKSLASGRHPGPVSPTRPPSATKNTTSLPREKRYPAQLHYRRPADPNASDPTS